MLYVLFSMVPYVIPNIYELIIHGGLRPAPPAHHRCLARAAPERSERGQVRAFLDRRRAAPRAPGIPRVPPGSPGGARGPFGAPGWDPGAPRGHQGAPWRDLGCSRNPRGDALLGPRIEPGFLTLTLLEVENVNPLSPKKTMQKPRPLGGEPGAYPA